MNNKARYFETSLNENLGNNLSYDIINTFENSILTGYSLWNNDVNFCDSLEISLRNTLFRKLRDLNRDSQ